MKNKASFVILLIAIVCVTAPFYLTRFEALGQGQLKRFSSYEELKNFLKTNSQNGYYKGPWLEDTRMFLTATDTNTGQAFTPDYSKTNIQVEGVDEADVVKTDGEYIYVISENNIVIVKAYPPEEATVLYDLKLNGTLRGAFINGDRLVVFEEEFSLYYLCETLGITKSFAPYQTPKISIRVYDVSNRTSPVSTRNVTLDGSYFNSRMMGNFVYVVISQPIYHNESEVALPKIYSDNRFREVPASDIYYANVTDYFYAYTTIVAVNVQNDAQEPTLKPFLLGETSNMYVSLNNIYITFPGQWDYTDENEKTSIHRIHIENGLIEYVASGEVPGHLLNQFSMDEYNGHFRVATSTGQVWGGTSRNHVYILDMNLNIVGELEDLAPGETIYSARFMGARCYLVTFKKVDPLFVIDLSDPTNPKVLGQLKITGYSDYLHPYDDNHVIGIGKEAVEAEEGDFAWYQGLKISFFDVSDVEHPKEIGKYIIGDRGTDSPVLSDHKALLFDKAKNLLVIPVLVAEIDEAKYPYGFPPNTYGDFVWQGAYVFNISLSETPLVLRGRITHLENETDLLKSGYYFDSVYSVKRSLYIDNVLYTISGKKIKMNSLEDLDEINEVELPLSAHLASFENFK